MHPYFPFLMHSYFPKIEHICFLVTPFSVYSREPKEILDEPIDFIKNTDQMEEKYDQEADEEVV